MFVFGAGVTAVAGWVAAAEIHPGPASRSTPLTISEIMYHPTARADGRDLEFVEIFNTEPFPRSLAGYKLAGDVSFDFPTNAILGARAYLVLAAVPDDVRAVYGATNVLGAYTGRLSNSSGALRLETQAGACLLEAEFDSEDPWPAAADGGGCSLVLAEGSYGAADCRAYAPSYQRGGSPGRGEPAAVGAASVVINELLTHTDLPLVDYAELYNAATTSVDCSGMVLTDDPATNKYRIPAATVLAPGGFLVLEEATLGFGLSANGESLFLFSANTSNVLDAVKYGGQQNGTACGRYPDGAERLRPLAARTPGTTNAAFRQESVVINEIMFNPPDGDADGEYIELHNQGVADVGLGGWRLAGGVELVIPTGTVLAAGGYLVLANKAAHLIGHYAHLNAGNCIGDYSGTLSDRGEVVRLLAPDDPNLPDDLCQYEVDRVVYFDGGSGREYADGGGSSLELTDPRADNEIPINWAASDESAKGRWITNDITGVLDNGMLPPSTSINNVSLILPHGGECQVDDVAVYYQYVNRVRNPDFGTGTNYWQLLGNHERTRREADSQGSGYGLHLRASGPGDTRVNRCIGALSVSLPAGGTVRLRCRARWLAGSPELVMWLRGGYLDAHVTLPVPDNLGTPGQANSRRVVNPGPAIYDVRHTPGLPAAGAPVVVLARASDPDGVAAVDLRYRIDPAAGYTTVAMARDGQGRYVAQLPGQAQGARAAFYILARDAAAACATNTFPAAAPTNEAVVGFGLARTGTDIDQVAAWMTTARMAAWQGRSSLSDEPLPCTLVCGERIVYDAAIRFRGSVFVRGAYGDPATNAASYCVDLPHDNRMLDSDELTLDWQEPSRDNTFQRERAALWVAERLGLPAFHKRYVTVDLNGIRRATVYSDSQEISADYIRSRYPDADAGHLHKINDWFELNDAFSPIEGDFVNRDGSLIDYTSSGAKKDAAYRWRWEKRTTTGYQADMTPLYALVDAANLSGTDLVREMQHHADLEQWLGVVMFRHLVGDWDSFGYNRGKNMLAYLPPGGRWNLLNWDVDFCLGADMGGSEWDDPFIVDSARMPRMAAILAAGPFRRQAWQWLDRAVTGPFRGAAINAELDAVYAGLTANGLAVASPLNIKTWIENRYNYLLGRLSDVKDFELGIRESDFSTGLNWTPLSGWAPIQCAVIKINGKPADMTWTGDCDWETRVWLTNGLNIVTVQGCDSNGAARAGQADSINITCTALGADPRSRLVINEIMYHPPTNRAEFVELYNRSSTSAFDLYNFRLDGVDWTCDRAQVIAPGEFVVVCRSLNDSARAYGPGLPLAGPWAGTLRADGETLTLQQLDATGGVALVVDTVTYSSNWTALANGQGCALQLIDAAEDNDRVGNWTVDPGARCTPGRTNSVASDLPAFPPLWINEVQPDNRATLADNHGDFDPWLEICNTSNAVQDLSGYCLTDDLAVPAKWAFPAGAAVTNAGFKLVWADNEPGESTATEYHAGFRLATAGGQVALISTNGGRYIILDLFAYPAAVPADQSYGDFPDSQAHDRRIFHYPSPGATNNNAAPTARIYLNEWLAKNNTSIVDPATGTRADWFELYNDQDYAVDITGYALSDTPAVPFQFVISGSTELQPREFRLVWADDTSANAWGTNDLHVPFKLSTSGETLLLSAPGGQVVDTVTFGAQADDVSQGRYPDGAGTLVALAARSPRASNVTNHQYTLTATAGANGRIAPAGVQAVAGGGSAVFVITADRYYVIRDIQTNGASVGAPLGIPCRTCTWAAVSADGAIAATFRAVTATNGTPQWWLVQYGLTNADLDADALDDPDRDGYPTWKEHVAGSSPVNADSLWAVNGSRDAGAAMFSLSWPSLAGRTYSLHTATNLADGFVRLPENLPANPPVNVYSMPVSNYVARYFHLGVTMDPDED